MSEEKRRKWFQQPQWIQTMMLGVVVLAILFYMWPTLETNVGVTAHKLTGLNINTLFLISILGFTSFFIYFLLVQFWTRSITNTLIWAKLRGHDLLFHLAKNGVYYFITPKSNKLGLYETRQDGVFNTKPSAVRPLQNGVRVMPTMYEYGTGIDFEDVRQQTLITDIPHTVEDRIRNARIEERERQQQGIMNPQMLMALVSVFLVIGIAGYLIINAMGENTCNNELLECTRTLADHGIKQTQNDQSMLEAAVPGMNRIQTGMTDDR